MNKLVLLLLIPVLLLFRGVVAMNNLCIRWYRAIARPVSVWTEVIARISKRTTSMTPNGVMEAIKKERQLLKQLKAKKEADEAAKAATREAYINTNRSQLSNISTLNVDMESTPTTIGGLIISKSMLATTADDRMSCVQLSATVMCVAADQMVCGAVLFEKHTVVDPDTKEFTTTLTQHICDWSSGSNGYIIRQTFGPSILNSREHADTISRWSMPDLFAEIEAFYGVRGVYLPDDLLDLYTNTFNEYIQKNPDSNQFFEKVELGFDRTRGFLNNSIRIKCAFGEKNEELSVKSKPHISLIRELAPAGKTKNKK